MLCDMQNTETTCCAKCGYLSLRDVSNRELVEAERDYREKLQLPPLGPGKGREDVPLCFLAAFDFRAAIKDLETREREATLRVAVLSEHREPCQSFFPWRQGFTPKEHAEMNLLERQRAAEQSRREQEHQWQQERDRADRTWREAQAQQARDWRAEDEAQEREDRKHERRWKWIELIVMGGIVTLVSVVAQIVTALISRN